MTVREVTKSIYAVGVIDWERRVFDSLFPINRGTSYNSYLVFGSEKTALIDTVEPSFEEEFLKNISELNVKKIDYIISNHAEQDHSGCISKILSLYPQAKVVTNQRCKDYLCQFHSIEDSKFQIVTDRESISLGNFSLQFIFTPWVHWAETMVTYIPENRVLFTCDFLGSHIASSALFAEEDQRTYQEAETYYAQIMLPYSKNVQNHLKTLRTIDISCIAPSHGLVYTDCEKIISLYEKWSSPPSRKQVLLIYASVHGSTKEMAVALRDLLIRKQIPVYFFNVDSADSTKVAVAAIHSTDICFASPCILGGPHPQIAYYALLLNSLKAYASHISVIGSFSWAHRMLEQVQSFVPNIKAEFHPPIFAKGRAGIDTHEELKKLAELIASS